ncbi:FtsX-like permease family protein [Aeromicrobium ginsengisoli]|uniref:FtsX-like permease family protein n=1 Tax=Aeromicrobium ginsengisoli TaxID=363867 RepID=A0A5M4FCX1_9ACTN|nr:FtsX-like permease family protein [Aeromicrobium ginsengisoli]KAA1397185.1 FtsX-like permease family protein [Aeromicrobium ginsengisoli]
MSQFSASWRVALRAGRRDALRSKGRSLLIAVMVGTPVLLTVMLTTLVATNDVDQREGLPDAMGAAAASATFLGPIGVHQSPDGSSYGMTGKPFDAGSGAQTAALERATHARISTVHRTFHTSIVIGDRGYRADLLALDPGEAVTRGMYAVQHGRAPRAADEVLVTQALADHGATIGTNVEIGDGKASRVVGIGRLSTVIRGGNPSGVLVLPGSTPGDGETTYLIDRAAPVTWQDVRALNAAGFLVVSRYVLDHPPARSDLSSSEQFGDGGDDGMRGVMVVIVTAIVLEVVLLAGPAFAVGVRRQRRDLALLAATGASPDQIRRVVLGQALVLGFISCVVGAILGLALSSATVWLVPSIIPSVAFGPFEVQWAYVAAAVVLGSIAALAAAYVPARQAAKQQVAAVLAGRRGTVRSSRGWPALGVLLIAAGLAMCFTLGIKPGGETAVAGSMIAIVMGTVLLTPLLIGAVARVGTVLPLPLRLAIRDTARQRARSAPAIAAIMASVAGITTIAIGSASDFEQSRQQYTYESTPGGMVVTVDPRRAGHMLDAASAASGGLTFTPIGSAGIQAMDDSGVSISVRTPDGYSGSNELVVADPATLRAWGVRLDARSTQALERGQVIAGDRRVANGGEVTLEEVKGEKVRRVPIKAVVADLGTGHVPRGPEPTIGLAVISPAAMRAHHLPWQSARAISPKGSVPSQAVEDKVNAALSGLAVDYGSARVERGFQETYTLPFLALLGFGALAVLIGTMTATGLALSDARPDFSTLAAVGAAPRTRRLVAGAQAVVLASLGTVLGIAVGFAPGIAVTWPLTSASYVLGAESIGDPIIRVPWLLLGAMVVVVPLLAALAAMLFTRSRLPIVRRLAQ